MKVLQSTYAWLPLTENWLYHQIISLPSEIESHIVTQSTTNLDRYRLPNIYSMAELPRWRLHWIDTVRRLGIRRHVWFLEKVARAVKADILHSHFGNTGWADSAVAHRRRLKHVVTFYGYDVNYLPSSSPLWGHRYRDLFRQVDRVLCEGPHMAKCIVRLGCPADRVTVHHLGVKVDAIPFRPRTWAPGQPLRVLIAAAFREKKGIPYALEALGRLSNELDIDVTVIGDAHPGMPETVEQKRHILEIIDQYKLRPRIRLLGFQPHEVMLAEAYHHHVFLSPSVTARHGDTEGGAPISLIEMAATGMPVVSTTHCDIPGVIQHGITGLLAEERDVDGLVGHLRWLTHNPEQWAPMVRAARSHLQQEFNARTQGERLGSIYRSLAGA